jgi:hypothetical protein
MAITLDGTTGITTPGLTNTGTETIVNLTTTGNTILGDASTDTLNVGNGGLVKDASGNVGVGVTPSAWGVGRAVEVGLAGAVYGDGITSGWSAGIAMNAYLSTGGTWRFRNTLPSVGATRYEQDGQQHVWYKSPTAVSTAGNAITFTQAMTLDASGNLLVGTTTASALGTFVKNQTASTALMYASNTNNTAGNGVYQSVLGANCNTNNSYHLYATAGTLGYYLLGNGVSTFSSDERLKKNIESTRDGYIDDLCKLRVVKYNWNTHEEGTPKEIGLIAQEVEKVFPGLVQDALHPSEDGIAYKTLKASVLPFMLLKAIQEQQAMIDELKAKVAALEAA